MAIALFVLGTITSVFSLFVAYRNIEYEFGIPVFFLTKFSAENQYLITFLEKNAIQRKIHTAANLCQHLVIIDLALFFVVPKIASYISILVFLLCLLCIRYLYILGWEKTVKVLSVKIIDYPKVIKVINTPEIYIVLEF